MIGPLDRTGLEIRIPAVTGLDPPKSPGVGQPKEGGFEVTP
jgi:hypothetical protein